MATVTAMQRTTGLLRGRLRPLSVSVALNIYLFIVMFFMWPIHANMFVYAQYVSNDDTRKTNSSLWSSSTSYTKINILFVCLVLFQTFVCD